MKPLPSEALKSNTLADLFYVNRFVKELQNVINAIKEINRLVRKRILRQKRERHMLNMAVGECFPKDVIFYEAHRLNGSQTAKL